jgi:ArsR family transcriptional regulator, arsenate/arsenite/antimonite-responsive transcriptional repressor
MTDRCAAVFQAMADPSRLKILELLKRHEELCVSEIARHFAMRQPSISHHLVVLRHAGLVESEKRGREVYYRFNREAMVECCGRQLKVLDLELRVVKSGSCKAVVLKGKGPVPDDRT